MKRKDRLFGLRPVILLVFWILLWRGSYSISAQSASKHPCPCEADHFSSTQDSTSNNNKADAYLPDECFKGEAYDHFVKAQLDWKAKRWDKGLEKYRKIISDHPQNYWAAISHMAIGLYLKYNKHWDEAINEFQCGIDQIPHSRAAQDSKTSIACIHTFRGNYQEAKDILKEILSETKDWDQVKYCSYWIRRINRQEDLQREFPWISCGPRALSTLLKLKGIDSSPKEIEDLCSVKNNMISLEDLKKAAHIKGLKTQGVKDINLEQLTQAELPAIALVKPGHYIVINEIDKDVVRISDPYIRGGMPFKIYDKKLLENIWTGYLLIVTEQIVSSDNIIHLTEKEMAEIKGGVCYCCPENDLGGEDENSNTAFDPGGDPCALGGGQSPGMPSIKVNTINLNLIIQDVDLSFGSLGPNVFIQRTYNADDSRESAFGRSWTFNYNQYLIENPGGIVDVIKAQGATHQFIPYGNGSYDPPSGVYDVLTRHQDGTFSLYCKKEKTTCWFDSNGILKKISDRNGNSVLFEYDIHNRLVSIIDAVGRTTYLTYNENNKIIAITDPLGRQATYTYDGSGNLISTTDMAGNSVTYAYDSNSYLTSITTARGTTTISSTPTSEGIAVRSITYPSGNVYTYCPYTYYQTKVTGPEGGFTLFSFERLYINYVTTSITDALGNAIRYAYYPYLNQIISITDPNNQTTQLEYDPYGNINKLTDPMGHSYFYTYDSRDNLITRTDPLGRTYTYTYDSNSNLISILDPQDNRTNLGYNSKGLLVSLTNPLGHTATFTYDSQGNLISARNPLNQTTSYTCDALGRTLSARDANGNTRFYTYDGLDRLVKITYPDGTYEDFNYSCCGFESVKDRNGRTTLFKRDNDNRLTGVIDALNHQTTYQYDKAGNRIAVIDAENQVTLYKYDLVGRLIGEIKGDGNCQTLLFDDAEDPQNGILFWDDLENGSSNWTPDYPWGLTESASKSLTHSYTDSPSGYCQTKLNTSLYLAAQDFSQCTPTIMTYWTRYDIAINGADYGSVEVSNNGGITWTEMDHIYGRQLDWKERRISLYQYDGFSDVRIRFRFNCGNAGVICDGWYIDDVKIYSYPYGDVPWGVTETASKSATHSYTDSPSGDYEGNVNASLYLTPQDLSMYINTALTYWTRYETELCCDYGVVEVSIDGGANWKEIDRVQGSQLDWAERRIQLYQYDGFPDVRIRFRFYSDGSMIRDDGWYIDDIKISAYRCYRCNDIYQYNYNGVGNLISKVNSQDRITTYSYNANNRLISIDYSGSKMVSFDYDEAGNLITMADGIGNSNFSYDGLNRLTSFTSSFRKQISYGYDAVGNCTSLTYPDSKTVSFAYNPVGKLIRLIDWLNNEITFGWDAVGNLTQITYPNGVISTMSYDTSNRLISLNHTKGTTIASYQYTLDGVGNRVAAAFNQPLASIPPTKTRAYSYSTPNKLTSVDGTTTYAYDDLGNTISKVSSGATTTYTYDDENRLIQVQSPTGTTQYTYNGFGHRVIKHTSSQMTLYVLDIQGSLPQVLAETDRCGQITAYYVYGPGIGLISKITPTGQAYYYHYDGLGSTIFMTDSSGNIVNKYAYDEFGNLTGYVESIPNPFRYVGRYGVMDEGNGLLFMRARYYDPEIGRFLTPDPIGFAGGDVNLYSYVGNNPVNWIDPLGLDYLTFNGERLTWVSEIWIIETGRTSWVAGSGTISRSGEVVLYIPEGKYYTSPSDKEWHPREETSWGPFSYRLHESLITRLWNRLSGRTGGFHIHGGMLTGTAGCIEFRDYSVEQTALYEFNKMLQNYGKKIKLLVDYNENDNCE